MLRQKHTDVIKEQVNNYMKEHSGLDLKRNYLGMSGIGYCPRELYRGYYNLKTPTLKDYRNCYRGYHLESHFRKMFEELSLIRKESGKELVAGFDSRFRGHIDGEDNFGNLIEFKSMSSVRFEHIVEAGKIAYKHFMQIQTYMKYGSYEAAYVVCVNTGTFEVISIRLVKNEKCQTEIEEKAKMILKSIDLKTEPACECGKCKIYLK